MIELDPEGKVTRTEGSWRAGVDPGIFMTRAPRRGQSFRPELYAGEAEDDFRVVRLRAPVTVPAGHFGRLETSRLVAAHRSSPRSGECPAG